MRIGFDVDGVLTKLRAFIFINGIKFFNRKPQNIFANEIDEMFDCTKDEKEKFWAKYIIKYAIEEHARNHAAEIIKKLKDENNYIIIITSRSNTTKKDLIGKMARKMLLYWLKKENISYDAIYFCDDKNSAIEKAKL